MLPCIIFLITLIGISNSLLGQMYLEKGLSRNLEERRSPSEETFDNNDDVREEMLRQHEDDCNEECDD